MSIVSVTALITLTVTAIGLVETVDEWVSVLHPTRLKITATSVKPDARSSNSRALTTSGSFENIGEGELLWLAIRPPDDSRIYPNAQPCDTNARAKTWSCSVLFGAPMPGRLMPFHVIIMRVNAQAVNALLDYYQTQALSSPGLQTLPSGAVIGTEKDVLVQ